MKRWLTILLLFVPAVAWAGPSSFDALVSKGWLWAYLGVFAAGFMTSLTPCVYPMITITVGIFGAREATTRLRALGLAAMYVLGMVVTFSTLGVVFALAGRASGFGYLLSKPAFVLPIVGLYVVLAASMFGAFELNLPPSLQAKLTGVGGKGTLGAFLMGLVGGLTAAPCTGPILGGLFVFIGATRDAALGASLMTTFALGMGILFVVIAVGAMRLPKSGAWMEVIKAVGGIALLGVGFYFLRPVYPALARLASLSLAFIAPAVALILVGLALIYVYLRRLKAGQPARMVKGFGIALTTAGVIMGMNWLMLPRSTLPWRHDREVAVAEAKAAAKPVLIDFSASWCVPCVQLENEVFADPVVHDEIASRYMPVKFDVSKGNAADRKAQRDWNANVFPTVIVLRPDGTEVKRFIGEPLPSVDEFLATIKSVR